jgi:N6-adenosine-specific RNA methylase IME4
VAFTELEAGHYGALLVDVPWRFETWSVKGRGRSAERHYRTANDAELGELPLQGWCRRDACLFLWSSGPVLERSLALIKVWGFTFKTVAFVWEKPGLGLGYWTRSTAEFVLLATRGKPRRLSANVLQTVLAPRREHSRKPDAVAQRIVALVPGPYLELYGRQARPGWTVAGDEVGKFDACE